MDKPITLDPFTVHVSIRDGVQLMRDGAELSFSAAEAEILVQLLLSVMGVESFPMLPSRLQSTPFECRFRPNRTMELRRIEQDPDTPGVDFTFGQGDDLIALAKQGMTKLVSRATLRKPVKYKPPFKTPDIPVDGR